MNSEMTTDNMSNEEVIEVLKGIVFNGFDRTTRKERQALDLAIKALEDRPQGEWIEQKNYPFCYKCNQCGTENTHKANFCENCGADMQRDDTELKH